MGMGDAAFHMQKCIALNHELQPINPSASPQVFAVGHAMFIFLVPLQFYLGRRFVKFRRRVASITDARAGLVSQAVSGVRIMKMNAWELEFRKRIAATRAEEVAALQAASRFKALNEAIYYCSSVVVAALIFAVDVGMGNELTPRKVYTTLTRESPHAERGVLP